MLESEGAAGETALARLSNAEGTQFGIAAGAIAIGDTLYAADNGRLTKTKSGSEPVEGKALTAAANAGDIFTYLAKLR